MSCLVDKVTILTIQTSQVFTLSPCTLPRPQTLLKSMTPRKKRAQLLPLFLTISSHYLLSGVDPLAEHDRAVGAISQRLEGDVPVHGPHVVTAGH